jgi:Tfp pilus assembly protein PilO
MNISTKRVLIDKANTSIIIIISVASALVSFSLVASKALISQQGYQSRVIKEKVKARDQLKANSDNVKKLVSSYSDFVNQDINVISGVKSGSGDRDGDNAKIILDALPSKYDFPALASSIEKIMNVPNVSLVSFTGTDQELTLDLPTASTAPASSSAVEIPITLSLKGPYVDLQNALSVLQRSIRPIQVLSLDFSGSDSSMSLSISAKTYYQPSIGLTINSRVIK